MSVACVRHPLFWKLRKIWGFENFCRKNYFSISAVAYMRRRTQICRSHACEMHFAEMYAKFEIFSFFCEFSDLAWWYFRSQSHTCAAGRKCVDHAFCKHVRWRKAFCKPVRTLLLRSQRYIMGYFTFFVCLFYSEKRFAYATNLQITTDNRLQ